MMFTKEEIDSIYPNYWKIKQKPKFTEIELAVMEGGHSLEAEPKKESFSFIKSLKNTPLGPL